jgi:hypothetical protein
MTWRKNDADTNYPVVAMVHNTLTRSIPGQKVSSRREKRHTEKVMAVMHAIWLIHYPRNVGST